jgi:hypothetical protein
MTRNERCPHGWPARIAALAALLLLPACVRFPLLEKPVEGSYRDKGVPKFIAAGKTTRADVRATLGKPDGAAADESWYTYGYAHNRGGTGIATYAVAPEPFGAVTMDYGRLVVRFSDAGLVEAAHFEQMSCSYVSTPHGLPKGKPCLDVHGADLPRLRGARK